MTNRKILDPLPSDTTIVDATHLAEETLNEAAIKLGFQNEAEMCRLVATVDLSTPKQFADFMAWRENDGTKSGLERLL